MKSFAIVFYAIVFFGGMGTLCICWAVVTLGRSEYLTAIVVAGFAVFCIGLVAQLTIAKLGAVKPRSVCDAGGTTIRPDRAVDLLTLVSTIAVLLAMVIFAAFAPAAKLDIPIPHSMRLYIPFACAAGAVWAVLFLWRAIARGATSYLRLTPNGFEFGQGLSPLRGAWNRVTNVGDRRPEGRLPLRSVIVMAMSDGQLSTLVSADSFTPGGKALRELVRFYWRHPEQRNELTDSRALERLRDERFEPETRANE